MGMSYIEHKGKKVLFVDYSGCKTSEDMVALLDKVREEFLNTSGKFLTLNNFNNTFGTQEFMDKANRYGKEIFDERTEKTAVLGITGIKKILLTGYNQFVKNKQKPFSTKEAALDYLVS